LAIITARSAWRLEDATERSEVRIIAFRPGCSYRQRLENILATRGVVVTRCLQFATIDGILACVGAGAGLTLLPKAIAISARDQGRVAIHDLPPSEAWADTAFIRRREARVSSALAAFLELARDRLPAQVAA